MPPPPNTGTSNAATLRLVVFDLDETLVHAREQPLDAPHIAKVGPYYVYARPHARRVLQFTASKFEVGVWSSSSEEYVQRVVQALLPEGYPLKFAWSVDRCVQRPDIASGGYVYIKDLRRLMCFGYAPESVLMVDDSAEKVARQPRSHLAVRPFTGDQSDVELLAVEAALASRISESPR